MLAEWRGGLVFKAHRLLYHSTLGSRVIKKKRMAGTPEDMDLIQGLSGEMGGPLVRDPPALRANHF